LKYNSNTGKRFEKVKRSSPGNNNDMDKDMTMNFYEMVIKNKLL
jgi:hypothetical protein